MNKTPKFGIIVGRFQVPELHDGHKELINTVIQRHDRTVIFLGTSPTLNTIRNPLDVITRQRMIQASFPFVLVQSIPDMASDIEWSKELDRRIHEVAGLGNATLYGGRDSFVPHYHGELKVEELPLEIKKSGEEVRLEVADTVIASSDFRAGVIYATQNRHPVSFQTVDVALLKERTKGGLEIALGKKRGEAHWRFFGGFVSPTDTSLEHTVRREMSEEAPGISIDKVHYISSHRVEDWRYKKERDQILTSLFAAMYQFGHLGHGDDIEETHWFPIGSLDQSLIMPVHHPLLASLWLWLEKENKFAHISQEIA